MNYIQPAQTSVPATIDPFDMSMRLFVVVAFPRSPSRSFQMALSIARTATEFQAAEIGGLQMHVAGFDKTATGATKALALIDLVKGWKGQMVFSAGRLLRSTTEIVEFLECFSQASACRDPASHCHVVIDDPARWNTESILRVSPFGKLHEERPPPKKYVFPCALLFKRYLLDPDHPSSYQDQIQAAAVKRGIHVCPFFNPDDMREIE